MDNYFTSIPLFEELRDLDYGAVGTTRNHASFPDGLVTLEEKYITKLEWNTLLAKVVDRTLCLAWQDNNVVLTLSTIHTTNSINSFQEKQRRRPAKTSTNGRIVRQAFGDNPTQILRIPTFIADYNIYMGGVDIANQFRESYETHRTTRRKWWPILYWLIDVIVINSYRLSQLNTTDKGNTISYMQFRIDLYTSLLNYSTSVKLNRLRIELGGKRLFGSNQPHIHYWVKGKQATCVWCLYQERRRRIIDGIDSTVYKRTKSYWGCNFCKVSLCYGEGKECWVLYHSNTV